MDVQGSIVITGIGAVFLTILALAWWFTTERPIAERTSRGDLYPPMLFGLRPGGHGMSERSVRGTAIFSVLLVAGLMILTFFVGYLWWYGVAGYTYAIVSPTFFALRGIMHRRFRASLSATGVGFLPLSAALALAWTDYCGWMSLPMLLFLSLNLLSLIVFMWVAVTHIPEARDG